MVNFGTEDSQFREPDAARRVYPVAGSVIHDAGTGGGLAFAGTTLFPRHFVVHLPGILVVTEGAHGDSGTRGMIVL
jgi:hypothetical protein